MPTCCMNSVLLTLYTSLLSSSAPRPMRKMYHSISVTFAPSTTTRMILSGDRSWLRRWRRRFSPCLRTRRTRSCSRDSVTPTSITFGTDADYLCCLLLSQHRAMVLFSPTGPWREAMKTNKEEIKQYMRENHVSRSTPVRHIYKTKPPVAPAQVVNHKWAPATDGET